ncbi:hypothetical protein LNP56_28170 [Klebsiella pneumoniae subsp. pneumoniae]|nr:hypothetical protein [Klebsiella pneumoniae subsp. pneumoniae]
MVYGDQAVRKLQVMAPSVLTRLVGRLIGGVMPPPCRYADAHWLARHLFPAPCFRFALATRVAALYLSESPVPTQPGVLMVVRRRTAVIFIGCSSTAM